MLTNKIQLQINNQFKTIYYSYSIYGFYTIYTCKKYKYTYIGAISFELPCH